MGTLHKNSGDTFNAKATMLGSSIEQQLMALNNLYRGKVEFCIESFYDYEMPFETPDSERNKNAICIRLSSEDTHGLDLPECEHINYKKLFSDKYVGNITLIRIPKCIESINLRYLDSQVIYLQTLVIDESTYIKNIEDFRAKPGMLVIKRASGNNKVLKFHGSIDRKSRYHYCI